MKRNKENKELIQRVKTISRNGFHNIKTINSDDIDFLAKNIRSTDNELVEKIYWAIGQIGINRPEIVKHLINYAFEDLKNECPTIRENALFALGRTGRADINLVKDRIIDIINLYKDNNAKVRMSMIWACENIANSKADLFEPYIKTSATSHNRSVTASPPYGGSGYTKTQSGLRPLCVFVPPQFFVCKKLLAQFPYRKQKTVSYSRNVRRNGG